MLTYSFVLFAQYFGMLSSFGSSLTAEAQAVTREHATTKEPGSVNKHIPKTCQVFQMY